MTVAFDVFGKGGRLKAMLLPTLLASPVVGFTWYMAVVLLSATYRFVPSLVRAFFVVRGVPPTVTSAMVVAMPVSLFSL